MKREVLLEITKKIETEIDNEKAYFGAFYVDAELESYIKANEDGVLKYVLLLLNSLKDFDFHLNKDKHYATINLVKEDWFDRNSSITHDWIEPTNKSKKEIVGCQEKKENKSKLSQRISDIIGFMTIAFILLSILVGAFVIIKWIFQLIFY